MKIIILLLVAYLLSSIPSDIWIGKLFFKEDIRQFGSGDTGTTNTFCVLGKPTGVTVLLMDISKGVLATSSPHLSGLQGVSPLLSGVVAVLGHTFPVLASFKGGKAITISAGMLSIYNPTSFIYSTPIFVICLYLISMASLANMISAVLITFSTIILPFIAPAILPTFNWLLTVVVTALTTFIFVRHRKNIQQIKNGTENRLSFGSYVKK